MGKASLIKSEHTFRDSAKTKDKIKHNNKMQVRKPRANKASSGKFTFRATDMEEYLSYENDGKEDLR